MLEPIRESQSADTDHHDTHGAQRHGGEQFDSALIHVRETSEAFATGAAPLADVEDAVIDFALVARACGVLPETLIITLKERCPLLRTSRGQATRMSGDVWARLVKRIIDAYFGGL